jgi:hypothetical protein
MHCLTKIDRDNVGFKESNLRFLISGFEMKDSSDFTISPALAFRRIEHIS